MPMDVMPGDWYLHHFHAQFGKIGFINRVMSVYRRHHGGIWWQTYHDRDEVWKKSGIGHMVLYFELLHIHSDHKERIDFIKSSMVFILRTFARIDAAQGTSLLQECFDKFWDQKSVLIELISSLIDEDDKIKQNQLHRIGMLEEGLGNTSSKASNQKILNGAYAQKIARLISKSKKD